MAYVTVCYSRRADTKYLGQALRWHGCPYKIDEVRFVRMHDSMMPLALSSLALNCRVGYLCSETGDGTFLRKNSVIN